MYEIFFFTFRVSQTLQRAKRRMEDQLNKIGLGKGKKKESLEEAPRNCEQILITKLLRNTKCFPTFTIHYFVL